MPENLDFLEDDRAGAQSRGFTQHDTLSFKGKKIAPPTLATLLLLEESNNRIYTRAGRAGLADVAGWILIHIDDEEISRPARYAISQGRFAWMEHIQKFLKDNPTFMQDVSNMLPELQKMASDLSAIQTKAVGGGGAKKKHGPRTGSRGSARR